MRSTVLALLFALTMIIPAKSSRADLDLETSALSTGTLELVVIEADGCIYCGLFRRDVLPSYAVSEQGKQMPVRFVDVNDANTARLDLKSPVDIVPTFIVVKSQHEVGRISGYMGPEDFFHSISYLLASAP
jgi:thioredoxin-related protein